MLSRNPRSLVSRLALVVCVAASLAAPAVSFADAPAAATAGYRWELHRPTHLEFEVPNNWTIRAADGDAIVIASDTPGAAIEMAAATGGEEAAADEHAMLAIVARSLQNAHFTSPVERVTSNGLHGWAATGAGTKNGADVEWFTVALGDGNGHAMLALGFFKPGLPQATKDQLRHVLRSIRVAR